MPEEGGYQINESEEDYDTSSYSDSSSDESALLVNLPEEQRVGSTPLVLLTSRTYFRRK